MSFNLENAKIKNERFIRISEKRLEVISDQFRKVCNLAKPGYKYTSKQADSLVHKLQDLVDMTRHTFINPENRLEEQEDLQHDNIIEEVI